MLMKYQNVDLFNSERKNVYLKTFQIFFKVKVFIFLYYYYTSYTSGRYLQVLLQFYLPVILDK